MYFIYNMEESTFSRCIIIFIFMATILKTSFGNVACNTPSNQPGACVLTNACSNLNRIMTSRSRTREEAQLLQYSICGIQDGVIKVCCENPFKELPSYVSVCKRHDPQISNCMQRHINSLVALMAQGDFDNGLMQIEPSFIKRLIDGNVLEGIGVKMSIVNVSMHGLSRFQAYDTKVNLTEQKFIVIGNFSRVELIGTMKLVLPSFPYITPMGQVSGIYDGNVIMTINYMLNTIGNNTYMTFTTVDTKLQIKEIENHLIIGFMSQSFKIAEESFFTKIAPDWEREISRTVLMASNNFVSLYTYDQLFPEK